MARIDCLRCAHSAVIMERMIGRLERLANAEKRLKCTRCLGKGARITVVRPQRR